MGNFQLARQTFQMPQPEQPNLLDMLTNVERFRSLKQGQALQQQELQQQTMQTQQMQRDQADSQAIQQTLAANPGATYGDVLPQLRGKIQPKMWAQLYEADQKMKKDLSDRTKTDLENAAAQHTQYAQIYDSVMNLPDDQMQQQWPQIVQAIQAVPGNKIQLSPQQPLTKQQLSQFGPLLSLNDAYLQKEQEKRLKAAQAAKDTAQAAEANANTSKTQAEMPGGPLEAGRVTPALQFTQAREDARQARSIAAQNTRKSEAETADEKRRADLAQNLNENLDALEEIVKRRPDLFGPVAGRWTGLKAAIGSNDPDIAALQTIEHQLGMVQQSTHGMRSAHGVQAAADSIVQNFHSSPDALLGAIQAARNSSQTFLSNANPGTAGTSRLPQGSGRVIDKATAQQFYKAAGGDPNKARQLAIQSGWKVQ